MKTIIIITIALIISITCNGQYINVTQDIDEAALKKELKISDNIKILKIDTLQNSVAFIDYNKHSIFHDMLTILRGNNFDTTFYNEYYNEQLGKISNYEKQNIPNDFIDKWYRLYKYKGQFYLYMDCEYQMVYETSDSTYIPYYMDGATPYIIKNYNIANNKLVLDLTKDKKVEIEKINNKVFKIKDGNYCSYYTQLKNINLFNIIVHQCTDMSSDIVEFEKVYCDD